MVATLAFDKKSKIRLSHTWAIVSFGETWEDLSTVTSLAHKNPSTYHSFQFASDNIVIKQ